MRKCRGCLCRSCMNTCYNCNNCSKALKTCKKHQGFEQMRLFMAIYKQSRRAPRASWNSYGISKKRYIELRSAVRSGRYNDMARIAARTANESIAEYILLSIIKNKSYEGIEYVEGLGRIPCGRTDFYGYRRWFYHLLDEELKSKNR